MNTNEDRAMNRWDWEFIIWIGALFTGTTLGLLMVYLIMDIFILYGYAWIFQTIGSHPQEPNLLVWLLIARIAAGIVEAVVLYNYFLASGRASKYELVPLGVVCATIATPIAWLLCMSPFANPLLESAWMMPFEINFGVTLAIYMAITKLIQVVRRKRWSS